MQSTSSTRKEILWFAIEVSNSYFSHTYIERVWIYIDRSDTTPGSHYLHGTTTITYVLHNNIMSLTWTNISMKKYELLFFFFIALIQLHWSLTVGSLKWLGINTICIYICIYIFVHSAYRDFWVLEIIRKDKDEKWKPKVKSSLFLKFWDLNAKSSLTVHHLNFYGRLSIKMHADEMVGWVKSEQMVYGTTIAEKVEWCTKHFKFCMANLHLNARSGPSCEILWVSSRRLQFTYSLHELLPWRNGTI